MAVLTTPAHSSLAELKAADHLPQIDSLRRPLSEWLLLLMLAAVQFTVAVDFVIMMPLGPQLMRIFGIDTPAFNFAVSAYAGAAGVSGSVQHSFSIDSIERPHC